MFLIQNFIKMEIREIIYKSDDYLKAVELRTKILRTPLGLSMSKEFLAQDADDLHFGIFEDDKIFVSLTYKIISETTIKMRQVATDNHLQGKGLGQKLVLYTEKAMKQRGFSHIVLHARNSAIYFYEKLHYKTFGDVFDEVGLPHTKMEKYL